MSRRVNRVDYHLDTRGVKKLGDDELRMILRGGCAWSLDRKLGLRL